MTMNLSNIRKEIDTVDDKLTTLFLKRMELVSQVALYKQENSLPVTDNARENELLNRIKSISSDKSEYTCEFFVKIMELSKRYQNHLLYPFGLLGENLSHSFSQVIHESFGRYNYTMYPVSPDNLDKFLNERHFSGLNVTIPYKEKVIAYCDNLSSTSEQIGSVNTIICRNDGTLYGDNTDLYGFNYLLDSCKYDISGKKALILGSGGASKTIKFALESRNCSEVIVISRTSENNYDNIQKHYDAQVIINATPVGMYPGNGKSPVVLESFQQCELVIDLIYNPLKTALLISADNLSIPFCNGLPMLVAQAKRSCELFTNEPLDDNIIASVQNKILSQMRNIVLIGMPGCGKTTIGHNLSETMNRDFIDIDTVITKMAGKSIPDIFVADGETHFRNLETEAVKSVGRMTGKVIATGGGTILRSCNVEALKQNSIFIYLDRPINQLSTSGRPLSKDYEALKEMAAKRVPLYEECCDYKIDASATPSSIVKQILKSSLL